MIEMVMLAVGGMLMGAGMSADKNRAPQWMVRGFYVLTGMCVALAVALLVVE